LDAASGGVAMWEGPRDRSGRKVKIVVIHDGHHRDPAADRAYAAAAVGLIVDGLRARGHEIAPLGAPGA
jgi:hypothetical protein